MGTPNTPSAICNAEPFSLEDMRRGCPTFFSAEVCKSFRTNRISQYGRFAICTNRRRYSSGERETVYVVYLYLPNGYPSCPGSPDFHHQCERKTLRAARRWCDQNPTGIINGKAVEA